MAVQRDRDELVKQAHQRKETDREGHTHTGGTRQYRFMWQYNGMAVGDSHCGDIKTQQASGSVVRVNTYALQCLQQPSSVMAPAPPRDATLWF